MLLPFPGEINKAIKISDKGPEWRHQNIKKALGLLVTHARLHALLIAARKAGSKMTAATFSGQLKHNARVLRAKILKGGNG